MKLLRYKKYTLSVSIGWYTGSLFSLLSVQIGSVLDDYPTGWSFITLLGIYIGYGEFVIGIDKE